MMTKQNKTKLTIACAAMLFTAGVCAAQGDAARPAEQPKYFHLDFAVKDLDNGKVVATRHYTTTAVTGDQAPYACNIRSGSKIPVQTATGTGASQLTYIDVGVNIDVRSPKEIDGSLAISVVAEISSAASSSQPLIRQTKWSSNVVVLIGKPTVIFSSDDVAGKGQLQLELTATPITGR
jgi:hypothetical protein